MLLKNEMVGLVQPPTKWFNYFIFSSRALKVSMECEMNATESIICQSTCTGFITCFLEVHLHCIFLQMVDGSSWSSMPLSSSFLTLYIEHQLIIIITMKKYSLTKASHLLEPY